MPCEPIFPGIRDHFSERLELISERVDESIGGNRLLFRINSLLDGTKGRCGDLATSKAITAPASPRGNQIEATLFDQVVTVDNGEF